MPQLLDATGVAAAAGVLARAFRDNPGMSAMFDRAGPEERQRLLELAMHSFVDRLRHLGVVETIELEGRIVAVSLAYPPGSYPPSVWAELRMAAGVLHSGPRRPWRLLVMDAWMRKRHLRSPHWYLWFLGVEPEHQGRGFGSALLRSMHAKADRNQVPCYLETDKPTVSPPRLSRATRRGSPAVWCAAVAHAARPSLTQCDVA